MDISYEITRKLLRGLYFSKKYNIVLHFIKSNKVFKEKETYLLSTRREFMDDTLFTDFD